MQKTDKVALRYFANCLREALRLDPLYVDGRSKNEGTRRERFGRPTNIRRTRSICHK